MGSIEITNPKKIDWKKVKKLSIEKSKKW